MSNVSFVAMNSCFRKVFVRGGGCALSLLVMLFFVGCGGSGDAEREHQRVREAAMRAYGHLLDGRFDGYVDAIAHADSLPESYRQQLADMVNEYAANERERRGGIVDVRAVSDTIMGAHAQVFLELSFGDSTQETVGLPMVRVNDEWLME